MAQLIREYRTGRIWIRCNVTRDDLREGTNADRPGPHMVTGMGYGTRAEHDSMGKISPVRDWHFGVPAGTSPAVPPAYLARKLGFTGLISKYRPRDILRSVKCMDMYELAEQKSHRNKPDYSDFVPGVHEEMDL